MLKVSHTLPTVSHASACGGTLQRTRTIDQFKQLASSLFLYEIIEKRYRINPKEKVNNFVYKHSLICQKIIFEENQWMQVPTGFPITYIPTWFDT